MKPEVENPILLTMDRQSGYIDAVLPVLHRK
jgi:hypothetical protein